MFAISIFFIIFFCHVKKIRRKERMVKKTKRKRKDGDKDEKKPNKEK